MNTKSKRRDNFFSFADEYLFRPYDCVRLMLLEFSDITGFSSEQCTALGRQFRTGMGYKGTCGLLTSALMIVAFGGGGDEDPEWLVEGFRDACGSCECHDIMPDGGRKHCLECLKETYDLLASFALFDLDDSFTIEQKISI